MSGSSKADSQELLKYCAGVVVADRAAIRVGNYFALLVNQEDPNDSSLVYRFPLVNYSLEKVSHCSAQILHSTGSLGQLAGSKYQSDILSSPG